MQTTLPDAVLHNGGPSTRHAQFTLESRVPRIDTALSDSMMASGDDDHYRIEYPESEGPI